MKKIQIEPTTFCNLNCEYCHRRSIPAVDMQTEVFEKINGVAKEYVIYGYGEPFLFPEFERMVESLNGRIIISTNGMFDLDGVMEIADMVGVSVDLDDRFRRGLTVETAMKNLQKLGEKGIAEIVVTANNLKGLPDFFERIACHGSGLIATNVIAPDPVIYEDVVYFEGSRRNVELVMDMDEKILVEAIRDCSKGGGRALSRYRNLLDRVYSEGYSINLLGIFSSGDRIERAFEAEEVFDRMRDIAKEYGVMFSPPEFFGNSKSRKCPYEGSIFVRADGIVSSCMSFAYAHQEFVNGHYKVIEPFSIGDLKIQDIDEIEENLEQFDSIREKMENFPWCADCPYVEGCWFAEKNVDCYANKPSCSECLYSSRIARCLLGD
ncbi:radical SAM/SPASM domain-containing protein [Archaeoglobus neptunius]|uniref:radical SAM/SPASM domain-containing protein n=1 Tax=Archaeoglobus neptunius TaxID=2798580 RepID=UPI0019286FA5|nr:radical SAM protein [Archaeoglobus neptunius]